MSPNPASVEWFLHVVGGSIFGVISSWITNSTLIEIAHNNFFATYFGLLFVFIGVLIIWRIHASSANAEATSGKPCLIAFGLLMVVSGIFCFVLDHNPFHLGKGTRVPLFGLLGMSVCFAFVFSALDLMNLCSKFFGKGLVETQGQTTVIVAISITMGCAYGLIFGLLDVEDSTDEYKAFLDDEKYCYPLGVVVGGIAGALNYRQRARFAYQRVPANYDYDDGI